MKIQAFKCPKCSAVVFSRTRHDYRWCPCKAIAVDGGLDYARVVYKDEFPETVELNLDVTPDQLYDDWNKRQDVYGIILDHKDTNPKNSV